MNILTYRSIHIGNHAIWRRKRLKLQCMHTFVPVIDAALIFSWSDDWPNSAIDKPKTIVKGTSLYLDGICIFL